MTAKERAWLEYYLGEARFNATEAARLAGYSYPNKQGPAKAAKFRGEIETRLAELTMTADEVLVRLSEMARGIWGEYVGEDGLIDIGALVRDGKGYLVKCVRPTKEGLVFEFYDAQRALVDIGKAHGVFVERHDVTTGGQPIPVKEVVVKLHSDSDETDEPVAD